MGSSFLEFMKQIGIFMICAHTFLHFSAGKSYEKYLKLLVGIMVLAQFAIPFGEIFLGKEMGKIWEEAKQFRQELEERAGDVVWESEEEDMASRALEEEVEEKLASAAGEYGYAIKGVEMRGDPPGVEVVIQKGEEEKGRIAVEKIKIESVGENGKEREDGFSGQHASMRQAFSSILNTDEAYIIIREE